MKTSTYCLAAATALLSSPAAAFFNNKKPPKVDPHLVADFAWTDPFASPATLQGYSAACEATAQFAAREYTLEDLREAQPLGLAPWVPGLKKFFAQREYPGGWSGYDRHAHDRSVVMMGYESVPLEVREWIEAEAREGGDGHGLFAVFDKPANDGDVVRDTVVFPSAAGDVVDRSQDENRVAIFAPGAIYHILPLWAASKSDCKDELLDLAKYKPEPADGAVVGWPRHKRPNEDKQMEFKVDVKVLKASDEAGDEAQTASRDEL